VRGEVVWESGGSGWYSGIGEGNQSFCLPSWQSRTEEGGAKTGVVRQHYRRHGSITGGMAVLQEAWQHYRRHVSITGGTTVLQETWQYYRRHGSITGDMAVLQAAWQHYRRHGSITGGMAVLQEARQ